MGIQNLSITCEKKLMTFSIAIMLLLVTFSVLIIPTVSANDNSVNIHMTSMDSNQNIINEIDAGENIFIVVNFNPGNENMTMYNVSLLTFNESELGMANAILQFDQNNWPINQSYQVHNETGTITNINASGNHSGNRTAFYVNLSLNSTYCGLLYVNVSNVEAWENNSVFSTIVYSGNITLSIHPKAPLNISSESINSSAVNLSFSKEVSANKIFIERNASGVTNWIRGSGDVIYNGTESSCIDNDLNPETTYYYQAWTWNETNRLYSLQNISTSMTTSSEGIYINGTVVNFSNSEPIQGAEVSAFKFDFDQGEGGGPMGFNSITDSSGYFELNVSEGGPGDYEFEISNSGYVNYMKWDLHLNSDQYYEMGEILLPKLFTTSNEAVIKGYIKNDTTGLADTEVMLLNMNFNYMPDMENMDEDMEKNTTTNETGYFEINASFPSTYSLIAFKDGYYAKVNGTYLIQNENQVNWTNISLSPALPDELNVTLDFTDLDDVTISVNRTIRATAPVLRYSLDIIPEIGNSNGIVSSSEVSDYLEFLTMYGPGFDKGDEEENSGPPEDEGEKMGGPEFLALPMQILLDSSTFDKYISGSHNGTLDNIAGTNASDNSSIYYNATFNITLDGKIPNQLEHIFNVTTEHNNTILLNLSVIFNDFYNITETESSTKVTLSNTTTNLSIIPGENNSLDAYAFANITLDLNQSSYSLPIIETPTWNITDTWCFSKTSAGPSIEETYTINGKPLRNWDRHQFYIGSEEARYLCYLLQMENNTINEMKFVTINDLEWLNVSNNGFIDILINDIDFPLYDGKTWQAYTWWGKPSQATVISTSTEKTTDNGTFNDCVLINYSNQSGLIGQQWFSPTVKFFVNRTQNISESQNISWNLKDYSHAPFFQTVTIGNITNGQGKITEIYANITLNTTRFYNFYNGPTDFILEGPFYKESFDGPPTHITWIHEGESLRNLDNSNPYPYVNVSYDGGLINASGVNGPYAGNLELRYRVHSGLDKVIQMMGWEEWRWITGTGTDSFSMSAGTQKTIQLNYNGHEIYEQGYDGPYKLHLEVMDDVNFTQVARNETDIGTGILYADFTTPSVYFNKSYFNQTGFHDFINNSGYFTVNASIIVGDNNSAGDYELCGGVHFGNISNPYEWGDFITGRCDNQISLSFGENIIPLNFDLSELTNRLSEQSGNHTLKISLDLSERIGDWVGAHIDQIEYFTNNYSSGELPEPPISLVIYNDTTIESGDYLQITAYLNISSDDFSNQTYDLHGGVHYNNSGEWWFIAGMGKNIDIGSPGNYSVSLNFSGMEIASSGQNGPYMIWMGLDSWPDHNMITNDEYYTGFYNAQTDFVTPEVQFIDENTSAEINGSDFFTVNVSINVSKTGYYHINGGVHYIENMGNWDNWVFIAGTGEEYYLTQNTNISINFDQGMIRDGLPPDYNGPLVIHMGIENSSNWQHIDHMEYQTNQQFNENAFSEAAVVINSTTYFINSEGNLQVNLTYYAASTSNYNVHGGVHDSNWWFITGIWNGDMELIQGEHILNINFSGSEIFNSMINGPYTIWLGIETTSDDHRLIANREIQDINYLYDQFSGASSGVRIKRENMSDGDVDYMNSTGNNTYVTVNVTFNVNEGAGTYWLDSGLNYVQNNNWEFITGTGKEITLSEGNQTIPINFNAGDIYSSGRSGTFKVWIGLRDISTWMDIDNYEYTTQFYSSGDAPPPPVQFVEKADGIPSLAYINGTDFFTVNVTLNVSDSSYAGNYDLHGGINFWNNGWWQHITGTGEWVELEEGLNNETLNFNVGMIQSELPEGYNNNLSIWIGINDINTWEEITHHEYITKTYQKNDFPGSKMTITGINDSVWGENFTINVTLNASSNSYFNNCEIHGGLNWIDSSNGWDEWRFITGFHQEITITENGTISCNFSSGDVYNALQGQTNKQLTAWISVENFSTWTELAHLEYQTSNTYSGSDFNPPSITINCTGDFYNLTSDQLQVNLTINSTSAILSQNNTYEIHSGIHYVDTSRGWHEWRFITGSYQEITLSENSSISLDYSGSAIYETGETGPFEVWVGISRQGQWNDLAHDEYTTVFDYSNINFSKPEIRIIEENITSYVNNGDLTINVTVCESDESPLGEISDYILEGCIHWKDGHNWRWITWNETYFNKTDSPNEYNVTLTFDGGELNKASDDGWTDEKLIAWFMIRNATTWAEKSIVDDYELENTYYPGDFSDPAILFNTTYDPIETTDGIIGTYEWLNVTVNLTVNTDETYELYASLIDPVNQTLIVKTNTTINSGDTNVTASFNGTKINSSGYNGTYEFRAKIISTSGTTEYDRIKLLINDYNYTDFVGREPEAWIVNYFSSYLNSTNHDFIVNITINGSVNGNFEIYGDLFNSNTSTWITSNSTNITHDFSGNTNNYTISLRFNGSDINSSGEDGNYSLEYIRLSIDRDSSINESWEELDFMKNAHVAEYFTHDEFGG